MSLVGVAWSLSWPPLWAAIAHKAFPILRRPFTWPRFWGRWCNAAFWTVISEAITQDRTASIVAAVQLILGGVLWLLSRRRRKRAPRLAGEKGRALVAALVRRMRETGKPRPALRPVPGGAR